TFIQTGMTVTTYAPELVWALNNIDLSTINTINNNGKLVFRIRYTAGNITATNGNNRFDNITIEGDTFIAPCTPVAITAQPVSPATVCSNSGTANFTVSVSGTGPFVYLWMENSSSISNGRVYSGASTSSLTLTNPDFSLNGNTYTCQITNCSGNSTVTSDGTSTLTVTSSATPTVSI